MAVARRSQPLPWAALLALPAVAFVLVPVAGLAPRPPWAHAGPNPTEAGLRSLDVRLEDAARTLGASRWYVFRRVTMPLLRPHLVAGLGLTWARALGEFGATITFAGNFRGTTQTLPLAVFQALQTDPD